jgi:5-methylcytosine-specific restriction endonuclease McrA
MSRPWKEESTLREAYLNLGTQSKVAEKFGCGDATVSRWMKKFNIDVNRPTGEDSKQWKERVTKSCEQCGSDVTRLECEFRKKTLCDQECYSKWKSENWNGESHPKWSQKTVSCSQCERDIEIHNYRKAENHFCTHECRGKWISENNVGPDHPRWKEENGKYYGSNWQNYKRKVRNRDEDVCQRCGSEGGKRVPDVHHIEPVASFEEPNHAHFMDNLIQLCRSCHHKIEKHSPEKQRQILNLN